MSNSKSLSGLQREVLALYRALLREAIKKDAKQLQQHAVPKSSIIKMEMFSRGSDATTASTVSTVRDEFRRQCYNVDRKDYKRIEHQLRQGYKQVKLLQMPDVKMVRKI